MGRDGVAPNVGSVKCDDLGTYSPSPSGVTETIGALGRSVRLGPNLISTSNNTKKPLENPRGTLFVPQNVGGGLGS